MKASDIESLAPTPIKETAMNVSTSSRNKPSEPSSEDVEGPQNEVASIRYIPEHKKHDAALTFPEKVCE